MRIYMHTYKHPEAVHLHCEGVILNTTVNTNTNIAYHLGFVILKSLAKLILGIFYHNAFSSFSFLYSSFF